LEEKLYRKKGLI